jgi:hypothetical protein
MIRVLLTDDDGSLTVWCPDMATAEKLGRAAIYSEGGVSAWKVTAPVEFDPMLIQWLRSGFSVAEIRTALSDLLISSESQPGGR